VTEFGSFDQLGADSPYAGIARRILTTEKATVQEYSFNAGASYPLHHHPQEQITLVLEGTLTFSAGDDSRELSAGAWSVVPGDVQHGITAGPAGARFLAILVPPRKESPQ
jgi:quercetin dioxygenase-like cupin family protein